MAEALPPEVLTAVFSFLDMQSLDAVALVCRKWHSAAGDDAWRALFSQRFGTVSAARINGPESTWRSEYRDRASILALWRRGPRASSANVSYNSLLWDVTHLFTNFSASRLICYNSHRGIGNISDPRIGKVSKRRIYASKLSHEQIPIACVDGSRFGLVYGFYDGRVAAVALAKESVVSSYIDMPFRHESGVTDVWIAKQQHFNETIPGVVVASAGRDGYVHFLSGRREGTEKTASRSSGTADLNSVWSHKLSDHAIEKIAATSMFVVAIDAIGVIWVIENDKARRLSVLPLSFGGVRQLHIVNGYAVVQCVAHVYRISLSTGDIDELTFPERQAGVALSAFSVDSTPGDDTQPKHVAAATVDNFVLVWQIPGSIEPVWYSYMALPLDRQVDALGKPSVTNLAVNHVVLLQAGYNGLTIAVDVLTGQPLRQVSSRIPRTILDFSRYSSDGLVPVTHLEVDPDPWHPQGVIAVRPMVQYFDLIPGSAKSARALQQEQTHILRNQGRRRSSQSGSSRRVANSLDVADEVAARLEQLDAEDAAAEREDLLRDAYGLGDLAEEEEIAYAVALSRQSDQDNLDSGDSDSDELRLALALSQAESAENSALNTSNRASPDSSSRLESTLSSRHREDEDDNDDDADLRRALELSLQEM